MKKNIHNHTHFCFHATGTPREYVLKAMENDLDVIGFSDHVPYPFSNGHESGFRMLPADTEAYVREIESLKEEFEGKITVLLGYEAEFYPAEFDEMIKNISRFPCDYLIIGQHFTENEYDGVYSGTRTAVFKSLHKYVDAVLQGIGTGMFTYIAHPDLFNYCGDKTAYEDEMTRLCEGAKKLNVPLELNFLGLSEHRAYPRDDFWRIAEKVGNSVCFGCDAHSVDRVAKAEEIADALLYASKFGIYSTERYKTVKPF